MQNVSDLAFKCPNKLMTKSDQHMSIY